MERAQSMFSSTLGAQLYIGNTSELSGHVSGSGVPDIIRCAGCAQPSEDATSILAPSVP